MDRCPRQLARDEYYLHLCIAVRRRAKCTGSKVGAVLVLDDRVIATGFNGTPSGMRNCDEGGCVRCNDPANYRPGRDYDQCICVHAEQNTLLMAARHGISVTGATCYTTNQPCFGCLKELRQAGIRRIVYMHDFHGATVTAMGSALTEMYERLAEGIELIQVQLEDGRIG